MIKRSRKMNGSARRPLFLVLLAAVLIAAAAAWAVFVVGHALPPRRVVMTTGPEGGAYRELGEQYRRVLARFGVRLELRPSLGNVENLQRLKDRRSGVSVGFVSGGLTSESESPGLESLGTIAYYPLWIFCRGIPAPNRLQELKGKRVSIGPEGGGTRPLVLRMLEDNHLENDIVPVALSPGPSGEALLRGELDCACMLTTPDAPIVRKLLAEESVSLFNFARADAYVARFPFLRKVVVPEGVGDLAKNLPSRNVTLIASTASLLIRDDLHPAIQFLLLQAADEIHSPGGMLNASEQFPAAERVDVPLAAEARSFYKSGGSYLQRHLPFWLWVFASRLLLLLIPLIGILYPLTQAIPAIIDLFVNLRLNRVYKELRDIDARIDQDQSPEEFAADRERLEKLDKRVRQIRVPMRNARTLYTLRHHLSLVRERIGH
ncbi:MAG TPA: TAXI family TRAP transporter solute-binding subunit [Thermoanaerobaculia bacterium]